MCRFPLWFNRELQSPIVPEELLPYTKGKHFLSTKQVPSALLLRKSGSTSVRKEREKLLQQGFILTEVKREETGFSTRNLTVRRLAQNVLSPSGSLASFLMEVEDTQDLIHNSGLETDEESESSGFLSPDPEMVLSEHHRGQVRFRENSSYRIKYEDPWKIHAASVLSEMLNKDQQIIVWSGDGIRLQDPIPPRLLTAQFREDTKGSKNKIRWPLIQDPELACSFVLSATHWGKYLHELCIAEHLKNFRAWARRLRYRINRFLKGSHDPLWSTRQIHELFTDPSEEVSLKARRERFLELLKTVDGIFLQRYLAYPEEVWSWDRFDLFTLGNISYLLGDEFLDRTLTESAANLDTAYSQLKRTRKWFKLHSHRGTLEQALRDEVDSVPQWCRQFLSVYRRAAACGGYRKIFLIGVLSQTRGCGTPPPLVILQSKRKFLLTISSEPPPEIPTQRILRKAAIAEVIQSLPDEAFTGLATKARVTVTTSSCWENTRREGGTTEEIRRLILSGEPGEQVPIRDLETGRVVSWGDQTTFDSLGEFIFWSCLDHTLRTPKEELKVAFLTTVKEPGKARTVTKARACLKVVLDLVNKLCSAPLAKGIRSSSSGMGASNHGWNFFNYLTSEELKDLVFSIESKEETAYEGYVERTETFADVFVSSTDYEEATDQMNHRVVSDLGNAWMLKCGIPAVLRGIVNETCFKPRNVYFYSRGVLDTIGTLAPKIGENIRSVSLVKGILMGDPLTKVVLHLSKIVNRHVASRLHDPDFHARFRNGSASYEAFRRGFEQNLSTPTARSYRKF